MLGFDLLIVASFLKFGLRSKLRKFAGGDLDGGASLRIAAVPRLSLRHRESAEAYQSHPIPFFQRAGNARHGGINRGCSLRLADFASASDLVNQIGFIHSFSSQVSFIPSANSYPGATPGNLFWTEWET